MKPPTICTLLILLSAASAQTTCPSPPSPTNPSPSLAPAYTATLLTSNLTSPRGIKFDSAGNLLVVEEGLGISALRLSDDGSCVLERKVIIEEEGLNHGLEVSRERLWASSGETMWVWEYDAEGREVRGSGREVVTGMSGSDHTSRTLLLTKENFMVINRGSYSNLDLEAGEKGSGHSQIKAFNLTNFTSSSEPYDFGRDGVLMGWGLRNDVGIAQEPIRGGIWSVENSADQVNRSGEDIHTNNPAEKLNFLGYLNGTFSPNQGRNFGYPTCFAAWNTTSIPSFNGEIGSQFAIGSSPNDSLCSPENYQLPRLVFQAHTAPLDILFNPSGTGAWITFHGSWNREEPVGYSVGFVRFDGQGEPTEGLGGSAGAMERVFGPRDLGFCPGRCVRPVGMAWGEDGKGLYFSSDSTGEVWVLRRRDGGMVSEDSMISGGGNVTEGEGGGMQGGGNRGLVGGRWLGMLLGFGVVMALVV